MYIVKYKTLVTMRRQQQKRHQGIEHA